VRHPRWKPHEYRLAAVSSHACLRHHVWTANAAKRQRARCNLDREHRVELLPSRTQRPAYG